jgi:hypothetical protein
VVEHLPHHPNVQVKVQPPLLPPEERKFEKVARAYDLPKGG